MNDAAVPDDAPVDGWEGAQPVTQGVAAEAGEPGGKSAKTSLNPLAVVAVFIGVQLPPLAAWVLTGAFSPVSHGLAALVAGVLVLILDRLTRADVAEQTADQVQTQVDAAVQRAVFETRSADAVEAERLAAASATIARRSRDLLDHEFTLIDRLEAAEEDPARLGDLFSLDHLATRMNRNIGSMLVLAGGWPTRQVRGRPPISEVLRAGVGEVEDYARVNLRVDADPDVEGGVVGPLIQLVSELLEWAMALDSGSVDIHGALDQQGTTYRLRARLSNQAGPAPLDELRAQMDTAGSGAPADAGQVGLHVVSRLAVGMGITVSGELAEDGAMLLVIDVPATVLQHGVSPAQRRERTAAAAGGSSTSATATPAAPLTHPSSRGAGSPDTVPSDLTDSAGAPAPAPAPAAPRTAAPSSEAPPIAAPTAAAPAAAPTQSRPTAASAWSYSGHLDGTHGEDETSSRFGLRNRRRRPKPDDLGGAEGRAQQAAALSAMQTPAVGQDSSGDGPAQPSPPSGAPVPPQGQHAIVESGSTPPLPQRAVTPAAAGTPVARAEQPQVAASDAAPMIPDFDTSVLQHLSTDAGSPAQNAQAGQAEAGEEDGFAALAGLIGDDDAPPLPTRGGVEGVGHDDS